MNKTKKHSIVIHNKNSNTTKNTKKILKTNSKIKISNNIVVREYISNLNSKLEARKAQNKMNYYNKDDDNTIFRHKNRCMCIDYDVKNNGDYSLINNPEQRRCTRKTEKGKSFCEKHKNCSNELRRMTTGYEPKENNWAQPYIESSHNCYSYFVDDINNDIVDKCERECHKNNRRGCPKKISQCGNFKPQPGDYHLLLKEGTLKNKVKTYQCPNMERKIMDDNPELIKTEFSQKCPKNYYKGAMVVDPDHTFHFYRQNGDGTWSHKPGTLPVTGKDASGETIYVPHFNNRNYTNEKKNDDNPINYTSFCGYYCVPQNNFSSTFVV
jgi:hypothetical protein